ncbi:AbrB/MazE/SpoVT family DNA-binding domain-containing protein [Paenibacillus naphthalenovorans]|uniref:AbrB/MazE/SpoVT family DNA-binding domain-containing protein n=1 Tax=Paenibacillus naphthalenovorans TaxID=162209 RepID=UPI003D2C1715
MKIEVSKVLHKYQVTLPKGVREKLDLTIGEQVLFIKTEQGLIMKKVTPDLIEKIMMEK